MELSDIDVRYKRIPSYVTNMRLNAAPTQLTKNGKSRGYYIEKREFIIRNCNDYPKGVLLR